MDDECRCSWLEQTSLRSGPANGGSLNEEAVLARCRKSTKHDASGIITLLKNFVVTICEPQSYSIILLSSSLALFACSFNMKSLLSSLSVVQTQNQLIISTNANEKITLLFSPSPHPCCWPGLCMGHFGEWLNDHNAMLKNVIKRMGACAAKCSSEICGDWEMETRSERPWTKRTAARRARGAEAASKERI